MRLSRVLVTSYYTTRHTRVSNESMLWRRKNTSEVAILTAPHAKQALHENIISFNQSYVSCS